MRSRIFIEPIAEESEYHGKVRAEDLQACRDFAPKRRREYLAWRAVVYRELGAQTEIFYNMAGAPQVDIPGTYIGVSHSRRSVAVIIADHPTAIDIESPDRDFMKLAPRYLSARELEAFGGDLRLLCAAWCAKECIYKFHGTKATGADIRHDIFINGIDLGNGRIAGGLRGQNTTELVLREGDESVVYIP